MTITIGDGSTPANIGGMTVPAGPAGTPTTTLIGGATVPDPHLYRIERAVSGGNPVPVTIQNLGQGPAYVRGAPAGATLTYYVDGGATGTITVGSSKTLTPPLWLDSTPGVTVVTLSGGQFG